MQKAPKSETYAAFLRGINVGGNKMVPMEELRNLYESLGLADVKTLLNSGNVVFSCKPMGEEELFGKIEKAFVKKFGFDSRIILRTKSDIERLIRLDPFKGITMTKDVRLNVSFLRDAPKGGVKLPYISPKKDFRIFKKTEREILSAVMLKTTSTLIIMEFLEEEFGKDITTRRWHTVQKLSLL